MDIFVIIGLSFIPLITFFILFALLVPGQKIRYLLVSVLIGIVAVIPAAFVKFYFWDSSLFRYETVLKLLLVAILFDGLIEESVKMLMLNFIPRKNANLPVFFTCCLVAGLTFGTVESIIYLDNHIQMPAGSEAVAGAINLLLVRAGTALVIHTACAGLSGLFIWKRHIKNFSVAPFFYAVILHGMYNFFADFPSEIRWFSIAAVLFAILECRIFYKGILEK